MNKKLDKSVVLQIVKEAVEIEKEFVCDSLPVGLIGMNADMMKDYIDFVADRLLVELGMEKIYNTQNPFFEKRVGEYQKAGVMGSVNNTSAHSFSLDEDF